MHKYQVYDMDHHPYLCQIAKVPLYVVTTWPIYFVNGYKFHTDEWSEGKKKKLVEFVSWGQERESLLVIIMVF